MMMLIMTITKNDVDGKDDCDDHDDYYVDITTLWSLSLLLLLRVSEFPQFLFFFSFFFLLVPYLYNYLCILMSVSLSPSVSPDHRVRYLPV